MMLVSFKRAPRGGLRAGVRRSKSCNPGDLGSIPGLGRSPGEGQGSPLQYSGLENSMDRRPEGLQSMGSQRVGHDYATNFPFPMGSIRKQNGYFKRRNNFELMNLDDLILLKIRNIG